MVEGGLVDQEGRARGGQVGHEHSGVFCVDRTYSDYFIDCGGFIFVDRTYGDYITDSDFTSNDSKKVAAPISR